MDTEKVRFSSGVHNLIGIYHEGEGSPKAAVVISHGFAANKESDKWVYVSEGFAEAGISTLRFDHAGRGESDGLFEDVTLTGRIADLRAAVSFVGANKGIGRIALIGSSFGGDTALFVAADPGIACAAIIATPFSFDFMDEAETGDGYIEIDGLRVKRGLKQDVAKYDIEAQAAKVSRLLIMHGTQDEVVPPSDALLIYESAAEPKQLEMIEGADHRFSQHTHRELMFDHIFEWFQKYLKE
ncbi:MAG: alpha/beta fold hydrolase [bacterium]